MENKVLREMLDRENFRIGRDDVKPLIPALLTQLESVRESDTSSLSSKQIETKVYGLRRCKRSGTGRRTTISKSNRLTKLRPSKLCRSFAPELNNVLILENTSLQDDSSANLPLSQSGAEGGVVNEADADNDTGPMTPSVHNNSVNLSNLYSYEPEKTESDGMEDWMSWQVRLYSIWQSYLDRNRIDLSRSYEPLASHRVEAEAERLLGHVEDACVSLTKLLPNCHFLDVDEFWQTLTGKSGQLAIDEFRTLSFDHPSISPTDRCCIFACSAVYQWVFADCFIPDYAIDHSNPVTSLVMGFVQEGRLCSSKNL